MSAGAMLVVDVGNSDTVIATVFVPGPDGPAPSRSVSQTPVVSHRLRIPTSEIASIEPLGERIRSWLDGSGPTAPRRVIVGSVVPERTEVLVQALGPLAEGGVATLRPGDVPLTLAVDRPDRVGIDRLVNGLAALHMRGRDVIAVDLGTASTFDCVTADGTFLGGAIAPGVLSGMDWLSRRAAQLPSIDLEAPAGAIGRNTEDAMQSGVFWSAVDGVDGLVRRLREEWGADPWVVATGGLAPVLAPHCRTVNDVAPDLTLVGLALAGQGLLADDAT